MARSPSEVAGRCCRNHATVSAATACEGQLWTAVGVYLAMLGGSGAGARWLWAGEALLWPEAYTVGYFEDFTARGARGGGC